MFEKAWELIKTFINPIRPMIKFIKDNYPNIPLVGVEIGVYKGDNAYNILNNLNIKKLYLIDPYIPYEEDKGWQGNEKIYQIAKKKLKPFKDKIQFIRKFSHEAVNDIPNNLDFVYIDGNHAYEWVKRDIELYYPKVRRGGVIGGHDFHASNGVPFAVCEFVKKHDLKLYGRRTDWWVVKE